MSDDNREFWKRVLTWAHNLDRVSYYDILGVDRRADVDDIRGAFYRISPTVHPDRHAHERDPARVDALNLLYARIREAYQVLSDKVRRREYQAYLDAGQLRHGAFTGETLEEKKTGPTGNARRFYELGLERLRAGDRSGAVMQLRLALQIAPGSAEIRGALARLEGGTLDRAPRRADRPPPPPSAPRQRAAAGGAALRVTDLARCKRAGVVGIDFGTSYTALSIGAGDRVYIIPDEYGRTMHPSVVHFRDDGSSISGWDAREMLVGWPRQTVASPKRMLGRGPDDNDIAGMLQAASYRALAGPNNSILVAMREHQVAIPQVCGHVIRHVRELAERALRTDVEKAVVSIPVSYTDVQRDALRRAALVAGIEIVTFIEEPLAAAMAYGFGQDKEEIVAVYDFGGGTFDFTVIDVSGYSFRVLARAGDAWLGGDDFDLAIANAVADAVWRKTSFEIRDRAAEWQRLLFASEQAKRELSRADAGRIIVDNLVEHPKPINLRQKLERPVFQSLVRDLFDRSIAICARALDRAGLDPRDMNQVVVSGGISRIPFIRQGLAHFFGRPIEPTVNPDEAICLGAGLRAAQLAGFPVRGTGALTVPTSP